MKDHVCKQYADSVGVTHDGEEDDGACVLIARSVGSPLARSMMRFCRDVLNGDVAGAAAEFDVVMVPLIEKRVRDADPQPSLEEPDE